MVTNNDLKKKMEELLRKRERLELEKEIESVEKDLKHFENKDSFGYKLKNGLKNSLKGFQSWQKNQSNHLFGDEKSIEKDKFHINGVDPFKKKSDGGEK